MEGQNKENLKELFEKFGDSKRAEQAVEDVQKAERILRKQPAPEPDGELIANIKAEIARALLRRKANAFRRIAYKVAAAAAAFIILAAISAKLFESHPSATGRDEKDSGELERLAYASIIPAAIWESDDIATDDEDLAILAAEIEQIESELMAWQLGENGGNGHIDVVELEMELIEINNIFWKG